MGTATIPACTPAPERSFTVEEFLARYGDRPADLIRGRVVEQPMPGSKHGKVCYRVAYWLGQFVEPRKLGHIFTNDTHFRTQRRPDSARGMDACFISFNRLPAGGVPDGVLTAPPELVFEILSPSNRDPDMQEKIEDYLNAGVDVVAILDPADRTAKLHRKGKPVQALTAVDAFEAAEALPGFSVPVAEFFE